MFLALAHYVRHKRYRFTPRRIIRRGDPATRQEYLREARHSPGLRGDDTFTTRSTARSGSIHAEVCSDCHPFYTGKQKILDTGGRVARFERQFGKKAPSK